MEFNKSGELTINHNPFSNLITITFNNSTSSKSIFIYNLNGKLVKKFETRKNKVIWNAQERGVYYIKAVVNGKASLRR